MAKIKTYKDEPPLIQEPSVRQGVTTVRDVAVLRWPEEGVKLAMTGTTQKSTPRLFNLTDNDGAAAMVKPKKISSNAIRIGDKIIHLPSKSEDPRVSRRIRKLPPNRALLPASPLTASDELWDQCARGRENNYQGESTVSVLSYEVLSQESSTGFNHIRETILNGKLRRKRLSEEILNFAADIITLQDVDNYNDFWRHQLTNAGYDVLFHQRTSKVKPRSRTAEGVLVAWSRDMFTLFKSETIDLNDQFEELRAVNGPLAFEAINDDVAIMVQLQPWQDSFAPSALTICSAMLKAGEDNERVRTAQAQYLLSRLERFNSDLDLPVILCGGFECVPLSTTYEVLAKGSQPHDPGPPKKPSSAPIAEVLSSTSVRLKWLAPEPDHGNLGPSVEGYWLSWRPGGNYNLGFKNGCYVEEADAIVYEVVPSENGARTMKAEYLQFIITALPSSIPHEFRVAAVNELGVGPWSDSCAAVVGTQLGDNVPEHGALLSMDQWLVRKLQGNFSLQEVLAVAKEHKLVTPHDITNMRHNIRDGVHSEFHYVQEVLKLLKSKNKRMTSKTSSSNGASSNLLPPEIQSSSSVKQVHTYASSTNLSPRFTDGGKNRCVAPVRKNMTPFFPSMAETQSPHQNISNNGDSSDDVNVDIKTLEQEMRNEQKRALQRLNGQDVPITGAIDERQSHRLMLRSAYDEYCWDGEPPFTTSALEHAACVDYILYSAEKLEPCTVLSLPEIHDLTNDDTRNLEMCHDYSAATVAPEGWNATYNPSEAEDNPLAYSGTWVGAIKTNENKIHRYLPNTEFPSSHLALLVEFRYRNQGLAADWSEPDPHKIKKQQKPQELQQQSETDQVKSQDSYWSEPEQHIVIEED